MDSRRVLRAASTFDESGNGMAVSTSDSIS
jgi:hypothetical protein